MNRETLLDGLTRLRELLLRQRDNELKARTGTRDDAVRRVEEMRQAAGAVIGNGSELGHLGPLGEARIHGYRRARTLAGEVVVLGQEVRHARKLVDAARTMQLQIKQAREIRRDRSFEGEAEIFHGWRNRPKPKR